MTDDELRTEHARLYKEASAAVFPLIEVHGKPVSKLRHDQERQSRLGLGLFDHVLKLNPRNWAAMWLVGKAYQRLGESDNALKWFSQSHGVNPTHPDVAREAAIAAMELGRPAEAIPFCERAIKANPNDPGLCANLALATLFSGNAASAASLANNALQRDPKDRITRRIADVCREVLAGKRPCPRHVRDIL
jgi:tetratricopeptide (TPR) repeat protein